jgi:hypothetical protein
MIVDASNADVLLICAVKLAFDVRSLTLDSRDVFLDCSRLTFREPSRELLIDALPAALIGLLMPLPDVLVVVFLSDCNAFSRSR